MKARRILEGLQGRRPSNEDILEVLQVLELERNKNRRYFMREEHKDGVITETLGLVRKTRTVISWRWA